MKTTIKKLRTSKNVNSKEMAMLLEVSPSAYSDKENGRRKFQPLEMVLLCEYFNVDVRDVEDFNVRDNKPHTAMNTA